MLMRQVAALCQQQRPCVIAGLEWLRSNRRPIAFDQGCLGIKQVSPQQHAEHRTGRRRAPSCDPELLLRRVIATGGGGMPNPAGLAATSAAAPPASAHVLHLALLASQRVPREAHRQQRQQRDKADPEAPTSSLQLSRMQMSRRPGHMHWAGTGHKVR